MLSISNEASTKGKITPKNAGIADITAKLLDTDKKYTAEPNTCYCQIMVTGAQVPQFVNSEGITFETVPVELVPSDFEGGYIINVKKAGEDYGVKVSVSPSAAGTVTETADGAQVRVTSGCTITAQTTKGDQVGIRRVTLEIKQKELPQAEISWSSERYIYDLASNSWNNAPQLTNTNGYPVVYNSTAPEVATVSETGKITPIKQGITIVSATVKGTDNYVGIKVSTTIRVTDSTAPAGYDVFEMVKKGDQLRENEQFIIVSGEPFNPEAGINHLTKTGGLYYALTPYHTIDTEVREYYEAVPIEFPDGDDSGERLMVSDDSYVLRLNKQFDTSAKNPNYPFLFQVMNEDVDYNKDGEILDTDNPTLGSGNNERIFQRYIQVKKAKLFSFVDLPKNIDERGMMNGNIRVLDPAEIEGYTEEDYIDIKKTGDTNYSGTMGVFTDKGEIIFNGTDGNQYFVRFNPNGNAAHFNVYALDKTYVESTRSKQSTFPIRIYRLANRVEKPSITVYPAEPVASETAYEGGQTYNNKVRVVIEQHPKTSKGAILMRQWQDEKFKPALPDYVPFSENQITVFVDGNKVVDENDLNLRYIDETRTLFAVSNLEDVYSESASATFNFKTAAPRISKPTKENGQITVRITRPANYTKDAVYYYVISEDNSKPSVKFNQDGSVISFNGTAIDPWTGTEEDTNGSVTFAEGETLWVGSFKSGYESTLVEYNNLTAFPECRPMQLLRLTDAGREFIVDQFDVESEMFDGHYNPACPLYINYRNDLVNEDGTFADNDYHYHYLIQRDHSYGSSENRKVWIEQISEEHFRNLFGNDPLNVDEEHSKNFEWTSDFYVFALNENEFKSNFNPTATVTIERPKIVTNDRTYTALENVFFRQPVKSDGSYDYSKEEECPTYYGAMMENMGKLGAKTLTTQLTYSVDGKKFTTETGAEVAPRIPSFYGFTYEYQYEQEGQDQDGVGSLTEDNLDKQFVKLSVPSAVEGKPNQEALIPIGELNSRHLNLIFKFHRPNISKHILEKYDIYYNIKFNRLDMTDPENPVRTLLTGSGVYMDTETKAEESDAVYRFRIDDVHPTSTIYPEIEISKVTFVGNSGTESYGQYGSNFGNLKTLAPARNNSERTPMNVSDLMIVMDPESVKEVEGKKYADWKYIGHSDIYHDPDIIVNNEHTGNTITLSSSFFHIESYLHGTDYYNSYEYLVKHDGRENSHTGPKDYNHKYYTDEEYGGPAGLDYDVLRHTIIARDVPEDEDGNLVPPTVVISPVYFFAYGADMKPLNIDDDDDIIEDNNNFKDEGGRARIVKVNDLPGAVSPTETGANNAPRRAEAKVKNAPSNQDYPMPHAGDTDMAHESILDLSSDPNYTVVYGGKYDSSLFGDFIITGAKSVEDRDLRSDSDGQKFDPYNESYENVRYCVKSDYNDVVKFYCPSAKMLKVIFGINNYCNGDNPTQTILIEQNSFSMLMYPGFDLSFIQIIPIADNYNEAGELSVKDYEYSEKRFASSINLTGSDIRSTDVLIDYTKVGEYGSNESTDIRYSNKNEIVKSVIRKIDEGGNLAITDKGIKIAGGNSENNWTPIKYNMEFSFKDQREADDEQWAICRIEIASTLSLNLNETLKDETITGNVWANPIDMSEEDGLRHTYGWLGFNPDINLSATAGSETLFPLVKVTICHPEIPRPIWVKDYDYVNDDYVRGTLVNGKGHEIYYQVIDNPSSSAPQKGISYSDDDENEYSIYNQIKNNGTSITEYPVITIPRNASIIAFAEHPMGLRSDSVEITGGNDDSPLVTGVEETIVDIVDGGEERWYTLQGVEVKNPSEGVYIRVKNGHSEKVILK